MTSRSDAGSCFDLPPADFTYLAFGAGVQSSAILALCEHGAYPRPDVAIFADTGDEPQWVYDYVEQARKRATIPIEVVRHGHLSADVQARHNGEAKRFAALPVWTLGRDGRPAPLRRQCTPDYKIKPMERHVRTLLGYRRYARMKHRVSCYLGISVDEIQRARDSRTPWITNVFPLLDLRLRRQDCLRVLADYGWPTPRKSSCVFCPYHSDAYWRELRDDYPAEWERAVAFDRMVRDMSASGVHQPVYVHRSLKPLDQVDLDDQHPSLFTYECSGHCGL